MSLLPSNPISGRLEALTEDGWEVAVIDVTHPAFVIEVSAEEMDRRFQEFVQQQRRGSWIPWPLRKFLIGKAMNSSRMGRGLMASYGTFLDAVTTYLLKLGPRNLKAPYDTPVDRRIAASLPALAVRLRLQDTAQLLATGLAPVLEGRPGRPLVLLNIGGGTAIDSLNALLVLRKAPFHSENLLKRKIIVHVLDLEAAGVAFGRRALNALQAEGAPLAGLDIEFRHTRYDWSQVETLARIVEELQPLRPVVAVSSEGALFEYGSDPEIGANLDALRGIECPDAFVVGSVTSGSPVFRKFVQSTPARIIPRGLDGFRPLAEHAGWRIADVRRGPMSDQVSLRRSSLPSCA